MIDLQNITKQFDGRRRKQAGARTAAVVALDGVDLHVARGEFVSIVGPSGSGTSTLLNLIGGLDRPTSGAICIDGQRLDALADDELTRVRRDKIGFIFQFFNLLPSLTCFENVALPLHLRGWKRRQIDERTRELLDLAGLAPRRDHLPDELSGGERQRVAIARAILSNRKILILDEATSSLDSVSERAVQDAIHKVIHGRTAVMIAHRLSTIRDADRILVFDDGRIVEEGTHEELVDKPGGIYAGFYEVQCGGFIGVEPEDRTEPLAIKGVEAVSPDVAIIPEHPSSF